MCHSGVVFKNHFLNVPQLLAMLMCLLFLLSSHSRPSLCCCFLILHYLILFWQPAECWHMQPFRCESQKHNLESQKDYYVVILSPAATYNVITAEHHGPAHKKSHHFFLLNTSWWLIHWNTITGWAYSNIQYAQRPIYFLQSVSAEITV